MNLEFCRQIFEEYSNIKFHENPSSGSRVVPFVYFTSREAYLIAAGTSSPTEYQSGLPFWVMVYGRFVEASYFSI